jgi:TRAP-type C4-dicarboxylate transport system permease small subunit
MQRLLKYPLEIAASTTLVLLVLVTFAQVVFRYVLQMPLSWSEEVARFLLMWLAALSGAYAFKTRSHFALKFVTDRFSPRLQKIVATLVTLTVELFLAVFAYQAFKFMLEVRTMEAPATQISLAIPYSSAFVGSALMLYYVIRNWWEDVAGTKNEAH